jgi:hypothetical protein
MKSRYFIISDLARDDDRVETNRNRANRRNDYQGARVGYWIEGWQRHFAIATLKDGKWINVDYHGNQLRYLTDWQDVPLLHYSSSVQSYSLGS